MYVQDAPLSQNKILALAKKATPGKTWNPVYIDLDELKATADTNVAKGVFDMNTIFAYLYVAIFGGDAYGSHFKENDNKLLGIMEKTDDELEQIIKEYLPKN